MRTMFTALTTGRIIDSCTHKYGIFKHLPTGTLSGQKFLGWGQRQRENECRH